MAKSLVWKKLDQMSKALAELDRLRLSEGFPIEDRIEIERQMIVLRESERTLMKNANAEAIRNLERQINDLNNLKDQFQKKWATVSKFQKNLDAISKVIATLIQINKQFVKLVGK